MDQRDPQRAAMRADVQEACELADLLDEDIEARLLGAPGRGLAPLLRLFARWRQLGDRLRLEAAEIGMVAAEIPAAAIAASARTLRRLGVLAKEKLSDALGQRELADAARAVQQQGVRQALTRLQRIEDRLVPGMHYRSSSADLICVRTAAASPEASITRTRLGSALASAR